MELENREQEEQGRAANAGRGQSMWDLTGYKKEFAFYFVCYLK